MAVFFSQIGYKPTREWKEEHVFWDPLKSAADAGGRRATGQAGQPRSRPPQRRPCRRASRAARRRSSRTAPRSQLPPNRDPREVFADWLITPKNPWFTRSIVNRVWAWLLGRGIIHEPDDIRDDNPPSNPELLAYLEKELVASHYDLKHLYRLILNSRRTSFPRCRGPTTPRPRPTSPATRCAAWTPRC